MKQNSSASVIFLCLALGQAACTPTSSNQVDEVTYTLPISDLPDSEKNLDHAGLISKVTDEGYARGERVYNANCISCHGNPDVLGSIPASLKFWSGTFKAGNDPYAMYQTITRGFGAMPPQMVLTPREKYDVIAYIRQTFLAEENKDQYFEINQQYLARLPKGTSFGPEVKPYHPWSDMDYGNFFINTYELVDEKTGPERYHSPGRPPYADENYLRNNFAYKGIAIRLDPGPGGVSDGRAWMMFDHDVMRVAGGWTGKGFIDWQGILLNDQHETYPRTIGKLHFKTAVGPGWANPTTGSFEEPRFQARDGRYFGPLPKKWANYKGLYYYEDKVIISYSVGDANVLELLGDTRLDSQTIFTRTLNISPSSTPLKMRIASQDAKVALVGVGASIIRDDSCLILKVQQGMPVNVKLFMASADVEDLDKAVKKFPGPEMLKKYTIGGKLHYPETIQTNILVGADTSEFAIDQLTPPFDNPWQSRMKLSGIDFFKDSNLAAVCTTDGDVWTVSGLTNGGVTLSWRRIASGLFQPLGLKIVDEMVYVICRDQLVRLRDLNGDGETDFYESFNHDHQVTDHFHEFAMGLQTDAQGNFYYAKSGRHAREALVPQHGTLIKVSKGGSESTILARGFRAANGVCINPDGSFLVTDQQGYWNPMNRVNWVKGDGGFYGNMWGYDPPKDSTNAAMEKPAVWIDMKYDRSPSELLWVDSKRWGPLNGSLLSFSYGFGKIQLVLHEEVDGQQQAGVIDLPHVKFLTGIMRGRFNPSDQQLYACGMSAWGTNQTMRGGGLYRVRYTGKPLTVPIAMSAQVDGIALTFPAPLNDASLGPKNFSVKTWGLLRSSKYGSDRYDVKTMEVTRVVVSNGGRTVKLMTPRIAPVDVMTIDYDLVDGANNPMRGSLQNTIHKLKESSTTLAVTHD